jgi:CheY-like chemotaxis protein
MTGRLDVLIVEDDHDLRVDLAALLEDRGHKVGTAHNGVAALEHCKQKGPPRVMLLDLMMPDMDGWLLRDLMARHPQLADVPIVIMTGMSRHDQEARTLAVTAWLEKPIDLDALYAVLDEHCPAAPASTRPAT